MPWGFLAASLALAIPTGFSAVSQGRFFRRPPGVWISAGMCLACLVLIGLAFWWYGFFVGLLEFAVVLGGGHTGARILFYWRDNAGAKD